MKSITLLRARVVELSADRVEAAVGAALVAEVRRQDDRPMFVELIAGHEGVSTGPLSGRGRAARKFWSRERVGELAERLAPGVPVFTGHGGAGRRPVGRMLAAVGRVIAGAMTAQGVAWISDPGVKARLRAGELDTCSIEAEVDLHRAEGEESWVVGAVRRVTGVALGDRRRERPGFPGAAVLRVIEEFEGAEAPEGGEAASGAALAEELRALRSELVQLREELRSVSRVGGERRLRLPPERDRAVNPLIPR